MNSYYLGVDGGGSKTTAAVCNSDGKVLLRAVGGSINFYSVGLETARKNMLAVMDELYKKLGENSFKAACIGMSALSGEASREETEKFTQGIIIAEKVLMHSDVFVALKCMFTKGVCAVVISGTGSMLCARTAEGDIVTAGGWGYILGDEGSGYCVSLEAIRYAVRAFDGAEKPTTLTSAVMKHFGVDKMPELIDRFYNPTITRTEIASFASKVFDCAEDGDSASFGIIDTQAAMLADSAAAMLKDFPDDTPVGLWGGLFEHHGLMRTLFTKHLNSKRNFQTRLLCCPAECGALAAALEIDGIEITEKIVAEFKSE